MEWEYNIHPKYPAPLIVKTQDLLDALSSGSLDIYQSLIDTRPTHRHLFEDLVPYGFEEFAGHYRGEDFSFLKDYAVSIGGASSPCCHPHCVPTVMQEFSNSLGQKITALDRAYGSLLAKVESINTEAKLVEVVKLACAASVKLCQIHPYANGNGHISRFMILAILRRYGYVAVGLPIDPRPSDQNYIWSIQEYTKGNRSPLLLWVLSLIDPN